MATVAESRIHRLFEASMLVKGAFAAFEIASGLALLFIGTGTIYHLAARLTQHELIHHPADPIAGYILHAAATLSLNAKTFAALYLLSHGAIKLWLVFELMRDRLWAYPVSLLAFSGFIAYQLYRFSYTHSIGLIILTVFDVVVLWLVWHEWRVEKARRAVGAKPG